MRMAHKVAKDLNIKFDELKKAAKKLGIGPKGKNLGTNRLLSYEEIEAIEAEIGKVPEPKEAVGSTETKSLKKGPKGIFIGTVYNPELNRYEVYSVKLRRENLGMYENELLTDCATVFGAMVEIDKRRPVVIAPRNIEEKGEE